MPQTPRKAKPPPRCSVLRLLQVVLPRRSPSSAPPRPLKKSPSSKAASLRTPSEGTRQLPTRRLSSLGSPRALHLRHHSASPRLPRPRLRSDLNRTTRSRPHPSSVVAALLLRLLSARVEGSRRRSIIRSLTVLVRRRPPSTSAAIRTTMPIRHRRRRSRSALVTQLLLLASAPALALAPPTLSRATYLEVAPTAATRSHPILPSAAASRNPTLGTSSLPSLPQPVVLSSPAA